MKLPIALLVLGLAVAGCKAAGDPVVVDGALREATSLGAQVAAFGTAAETPGPRSPEQVARVAAEVDRSLAQVASLKALIRQLGAPR